MLITALTAIFLSALRVKVVVLDPLAFVIAEDMVISPLLPEKLQPETPEQVPDPDVLIETFDVCSAVEIEPASVALMVISTGSNNHIPPLPALMLDNRLSVWPEVSM